MPKTERSGHTTTDHDFIRRWVEERGGWPARVKGTQRSDDNGGLIRIDFPGYSGEDRLERIEWDDWFEEFDSSRLALLHRDMTHGDGDLDRFNKLVRREGGTARKSTRGRAAAKTATGTTQARARKTTGERSNGTAAKKTTRSATTKRSGGNGSTGTARKSTRSTTKSESSRSSTRARKSGGSEMSGMRDLLLHEMGDLLFAERRFLVSTRTMAREAQDPHVKARVEEHVGETERHIERLQEAFGALGERPRAVKCEGALGLKEEHDSFKSEEKPAKAILSAFDLGAGLRVEHYEIAGYKSAMAIANALGERECADILKENLKEEMAMASFLEKNAPLALRRIRAQEEGRTGIMGALRGAMGL